MEGRVTAPLPKLALYVVYENPSDFPRAFVVRQQYVASSGFIMIARNPLIIAKTLDAARAALPLGLHNLGRNPRDDACIYEVWV